MAGECLGDVLGLNAAMGQMFDAIAACGASCSQMQLVLEGTGLSPAGRQCRQDGKGIWLIWLPRHHLSEQSLVTVTSQASSWVINDGQESGLMMMAIQDG